MFQFFGSTNAVPPPQGALERLLTDSLIITLLEIFLGIIFLLIIIEITRKILHHEFRLVASFKLVILLITLPKEGAKDQPKEVTQETIRQKIAVAETLFSSLGSLRAERGVRAFLFGRRDHLALEIVAHQGLISFYVAVPEHLKRLLEQQIHAQYPEAQIEEVEDYNIFSPQGVILGTYLSFRRSYIFPIRTYKKMESDPFNALTNALSKIEEKDGAAIQIVVRSAKRSWHKAGLRVAQEMQQGKRLGEAIKASRSRLLLSLGKWATVAYSTIKTPAEDKAKKLKEEKGPYKLSPMEEETIKGIEEKTSKAGLGANIRIIVSAKETKTAQMYLNSIVSAFGQYNIYEYGNSFRKVRWQSQSRLIEDFIYRHFNRRKKLIFNTEELASLYHFPLPTTETPNIRWLLARRAAAPVNMPREGLILGKNIYRGLETMIRIKPTDRRRHVYIIGKSGVGKSVLLANMAKQDISNGEGVAVIDPHGDLIEEILESVPRERADDVILFDPSDMERPVGLNMLEAKTPEEKDFSVQEMIAIFYKLFPPEIIGPMFEHNMRNVMLTLMADLENPGTLVEIPRMFTDPEFQKIWVAKLQDPVVRAFWEKEMAKTSDFHKSEMLGYLISKVGRFVENEMMRNIIGQTHSGFNFREVMDNKKILLVNLAKGKTGEVNSDLLGMIIVSKLQMAAMSRADLPEEKRHDFYLYIDEFQNFITDSIATILSEARKYRLNLIIAHQYLGQLIRENNNTKIRDAVLGNAGTVISFKIGVEDAETIAKEFAPVFNEYDVINVEKFTAYVKLLIDNQASRAFNMATLPPLVGNTQLAQMIKQISRLKYGRERRIIEREIMERSRLGESINKTKDDEIERSL